METTFYATIWSLLPATTAIVLAMLTKEVYSSLFCGIVVGAMLFARFDFRVTIDHVVLDGFLSVISDPYNAGLLLFLSLLGGVVVIIDRSGAASAFGNWVIKRVHSRRSAQCVTVLFGILMFIDDYFNCLTVGTVMHPITEKNHVSKAKLAYLIDATAAPVCIIAPVSSWAAAVSGFVPGEDGMLVFLQTIPYNFYAILTILMMFGLALLDVDFGSMAMYEQEAKQKEPSVDEPVKVTEEENVLRIGNKQMKRVLSFDLIVPVAVLIVLSALCLGYAGGLLDGVDYITALSQCDASVGLSIASLLTMVFVVCYFRLRDLVQLSDSMKYVVEGVHLMSGAIVILVEAWTLKAMNDSLGTGEFMANILTTNFLDYASLLPAIVFLFGCFLGFSTGTSWGTFGILIPIVVNVLQESNHELMIISIAAALAGAVCGDHCSPVSDTTIMSSAGAQCDHIQHVDTQIPYAMAVAVISFATYIFAGLVQSKLLSLLFGVFLLANFLIFLKIRQGRKQENTTSSDRIE